MLLVVTFVLAFSNLLLIGKAFIVKTGTTPPDHLQAPLLRATEITNKLSAPTTLVLSSSSVIE